LFLLLIDIFSVKNPGKILLVISVSKRYNILSYFKLICQNELYYFKSKQFETFKSKRFEIIFIELRAENFEKVYYVK
jgi:hypothetical protein